MYKENHDVTDTKNSKYEILKTRSLIQRQTSKPDPLPCEIQRSLKAVKKGTKSHIINFLLTSFVQSVRERICLRFFIRDLTPSSLSLYGNLRQILSRTDLTLG